MQKITKRLCKQEDDERNHYQFHIHITGARMILPFLDSVYQFFKTKGIEGRNSMESAVGVSQYCVPYPLVKETEKIFINDILHHLLDNSKWHEKVKINVLYQFTQDTVDFKKDDIIEMQLDEDRNPITYWQLLYWESEITMHVGLKIVGTECVYYEGSRYYNGIVNEDDLDSEVVSLWEFIIHMNNRIENKFSMKVFIDKSSELYSASTQIIQTFLTDNKVPYDFVC